jgi:hypothetical protein
MSLCEHIPVQGDDHDSSDLEFAMDRIDASNAPLPSQALDESTLSIIEKTVLAMKMPTYGVKQMVNPSAAYRDYACARRSYLEKGLAYVVSSHLSMYAYNVKERSITLDNALALKHAVQYMINQHHVCNRSPAKDWPADETLARATPVDSPAPPLSPQLSPELPPELPPQLPPHPPKVVQTPQFCYVDSEEDESQSDIFQYEN